MTDRIVYLDCQENGDPVVDEEGTVYGSISASSPSLAPTVRAYVPAEELDKATPALAQRDAKIAELTRAIEDGMVAALQDSENERRRIAAAEAERDAARAEVPECYAEVIRALHAYCRGDDNDPLGHAITLVDGFSEDQLRACGIEVP